ncbi:hypothetical protein J2X61_002314 [Bacillus sp. 3255]|nr:hypothetical protein [Bacillus sp. 3255]
MLYELRIYTMHEGKMEAIQQRFSEHTLRIFERLGMNVTEFWIDQTGLSKLYYVLEYTDKDERQRQWDAFRQDPEWIEAKRKSEENGPIIESIQEIFMNRASFFAK